MKRYILQGESGSFIREKDVYEMLEQADKELEKVHKKLYQYEEYIAVLHAKIYGLSEWENARMTKEEYEKFFSNEESK